MPQMGNTSQSPLTVPVARRPKPPCFSQGFALSPFTESLHEGQRSMCCIAENRASVPGWQSRPLRRRAALPASGAVGAAAALRSPASHPTRVTCTRAPSPEGCMHRLPLCLPLLLLPAPPAAFPSLPRVGMTHPTRLTAGSFRSLLKRLPLNFVHGHVASETRSHRTQRTQAPASQHAPAVAPARPASSLKNRPSVPQLNYWKSKYRLEA